MTQQSGISVRKSPFDAAKHKGVVAAQAGLAVSDCPYQDKTTSTGGGSWSRSFINAWMAGHQSVAQGDLFSPLTELCDESPTHGQHRGCSTVEHFSHPNGGMHE